MGWDFLQKYDRQIGRLYCIVVHWEREGFYPKAYSEYPTRCALIFVGYFISVGIKADGRFVQSACFAILFRVASLEVANFIIFPVSMWYR